MQTGMGASAWADPAPSAREENAPPQQNTTPSIPKGFSFVASPDANTSSSAISLPSAVPRTGAAAPNILRSLPAASLAPPTRSAPAITVADPNVPQGPALFNPQQAALLRNDPEFLSINTPAKHPRNPAAKLARSGSTSRSPVPRQRFTTAAPARVSVQPSPATSGFAPWGQRSSTTSSSTSPAPPSASPSGAEEPEGTGLGERPAANFICATAARTANGDTLVKPPGISMKPAPSSSDPYQRGRGLEKLMADMLHGDLAAQLEIRFAAERAAAHRQSAPREPPKSGQAAAPAQSPAIPPFPAAHTSSMTAQPCIEDLKASILAQGTKAEPEKDEAREAQPSVVSDTTSQATSPHLRKAAAVMTPNEQGRSVEKPKKEVKPGAEPQPAAAFAAALKSAAMLTRATSSGHDAEILLLSRMEAEIKRNPVGAVMKMVSLQEQNNAFHEMLRFVKEKGDLVAERAEIMARIDAAIAVKDECIQRSADHLAILKRMDQEERSPRQLRRPSSTG